MDLVPVDWRRRSPAVTETPGTPQQVLSRKLAAHNSAAALDRRTTMARLRAVYARGVEAYSADPRAGVTCDQFAQTRVTAFLHLLRTGQPKSAAMTVDLDLLPRHHPLAQFADNPEFDALHPRGRDGKFIEKGSLVHVVDELGRVVGTGKVGNIQDADHISVTTSNGTIVAQARNIQQVHEVATLHPTTTRLARSNDPSILSGSTWDELMAMKSSGTGDPVVGSGVNDSAIVTGPDGADYFVKRDTTLEDQGVSHEVDSANFLRTMFPGTPRVVKSTADDRVLTSTLAGSDSGAKNEGTFTELSAVPEPDLKWLNLADPSSALRLRLADLVIANEDRHAGNIMIGRRTDGKYELLPIDHGIALAPEAHPSDVVGQWNALGNATKEYIDQVGRAQATSQAQQMLTEMENEINSMTWDSGLSREVALKNVTYLQSQLDDIMNSLAVYVPEGH